MSQTSRVHEKLPALLPLMGQALLAKKAPFPRGGELPDLAEQIEGVRLTPERLERYNALCAFETGEMLPITAPHVLAAPLHTALLTRPEFPLKALGLIHISNRILQYRPIPSDAEMSIHVGMGRALWVPKGVEFNLMTSVRVEGELAWEEVSTIFSRGPVDPEAESTLPRTAEYRTMSPNLEEEWELPGNLGRSYASVSGAYNPIHLWALTARLFGFQRPIIHGMWSLARSAASLQGVLRAETASIDIQFSRPILLPETVLFEAQESSQGHSFTGATRSKGLCFSGTARSPLR